MKFKKHHFLFIFIVFMFLGIISINLFSDGMFMDGLFYAIIGRNMAEGIGSFWHPHLTETVFPRFYEHPPLAFGLQSIGFYLFGDSIYVERFYSLTAYVITGYLIVLLWKEFTNDIKTGWIPLLFWIFVARVSWAASNNMLENTMTIFVVLAALFYFYSLKNKRFLWQLFSQALYPL